jgi:hypothetical protein
MLGKLDAKMKVAGALTAVVLLAALAGAAPASAEGPWWHLASGARPTVLPSGGEGTLVVSASNLSASAVKGSGAPVTITDTLPGGLSVTSVEGVAGLLGVGGEVSCAGTTTVLCTFEGTLTPYERIEVKIKVKVQAGASWGVSNQVSVTGGNAPGASASQPVAIGSSPTPFGVERYEFTPENANGSPATQAGAHPFQLTSTLYLNSGAESQSKQGHALVRQPALAKDLRFDVPPGLVGNPTPFPQCPDPQFGNDPNFINECPTNTQVGVAVVTIDEPEIFGVVTVPVPLFNLVPARGEPARFGFEALGFPVVLDTSIRTGGDYGVTVTVRNITETAIFLASQVTFWGTPGDPRHNGARGWACLGIGRFLLPNCTAPEDTVGAPLLTMPSYCGDPVTEPLQSSITPDSWADPAAGIAPTVYRWHDGSGTPLALDGCNRLGFEPSISVAPDGQNASTPTGLTVGLHVPQEEILTPKGLAQANVRDTTVTLPAGVQLSPASADGLLACSLEEISLATAGSPTCPEASKVGTVEVKTPLLPEPLEGAAYLAAQNANPFGSLIALYIVAEDPVAGVVVKFAGKVVPDPVTGQLVSTFENTPQLPFSDLKLHFFGSARAPLTTPPLCGSYTTRASIAPWSGGAPAEPSSTFQITSGPNGAPCANPRPFSPGFQAGSTNLQAGAFTPFTLTMSRPDADQTLAGLSIRMPAGLSGDLSNAQLCPEPKASTGACPAGSLIGHTVVSAGLGNTPFTVEGGQVFITGPYKGAPFGLSILNPAKAGPFDLGYVVVRAKIEVDPTTTALHIVSDPLPTIIDGIPLQIQHVNVTVDRPQFTFNPTNCSPMRITGTMTSTEGASSSVATPFQVTNCATLAFKPGFAVSTSGKPSRANGESLTVKLTYPSAPAGSQANIAKVKVELPKRLPSRLTTLQKACPEATFDANPESCPPASRVGEAVASTPILAGGLSGPAYFVSHGGAKFPELIVVLKGENGVTVDLHGETFISKKGITSSTFATVPDVPVGSFELKLPQGPYSALAANGDLCKGKLTMPTEFVAQNGAAIHQNTKIQVTGCPKAMKARRGAKAGRRVKVRGKKATTRRAAARSQGGGKRS